MSTISTIVANSSSTSDVLSSVTREAKNSLGQDDFLKLLVTKMSAQDPMNPQEDTDFIAQMAQFSALEQTKSMSADIESLKAQQEVLTANGLIGRSVSITDGTNQIAEGMVTSVTMQDGAPAVMINGQPYSLDSLSEISPSTSVA